MFCFFSDYALMEGDLLEETIFKAGWVFVSQKYSCWSSPGSCEQHSTYSWLWRDCPFYVHSSTSFLQAVCRANSKDNVYKYLIQCTLRQNFLSFSIVKCQQRIQKNALYTSQRELLLASRRLNLKPDENFCNYYTTIIIKNYTLLKILYYKELALFSDICKISQ